MAAATASWPPLRAVDSLVDGEDPAARHLAVGHAGVVEALAAEVVPAAGEETGAAAGGRARGVPARTLAAAGLAPDVEGANDAAGPRVREHRRPLHGEQSARSQVLARSSQPFTGRCNAAGDQFKWARATLIEVIILSMSLPAPSSSLSHQ